MKASMENQKKTTGIILCRISLNDADQIITILTRDFGKISCMAKGSQRIKSKFCGRLEPLYEIHLNYFQGRELGHLNEAELISCPIDEAIGIRTRSILFYIAEITNKLLAEAHQIEGVYELLQQTLSHLGRDERQNEVLLYAYLIKLLTLLGFMAPWNSCCRSGLKLNLNEPLFLSETEGSIVRNGYAAPNDKRLTPSVIKWVSYMQKENIDALRRISASPGERNEVWLIIKTILGSLLNYPLKSEAFLAG
jgi:DNA repair protein RecO (recombination protein O)